MIVILLVTAPVAALIWLYFKERRPHNFPPGPAFVPVLGSFPFLGGMGSDMLNIFQTLRDRYGEVVSLKFGSRWFVVVNGVDRIRDALVKKGNDFSGRAFKNYVLGKVITEIRGSEGIVEYDPSDQWKLQRHTSMMILRQLGYGKNILQQKIATEADELCKIMADVQGRPFDFSTFLGVSVGNVSIALMFGERYDFDDEEFKGILNATNDVLTYFGADYEGQFIPQLQYISKYKKNEENFRKALQLQVDFIRTRIIERMEASSQNEDDCTDFVKGYLQELKKQPGKLQDWSVAVVSDFLIAGVETVTTTLRWALYYMAANPEAQSKVQKELDTTYGSGLKPKYGDSLPYTEATITEILRLSSTVPFALEHEALVDSVIDGYRIPKGTIVMVNLRSILMDPKLFPDPWCFRPERFLDDHGQFVRPADVVPFSLGRRMCMGEQLARQEVFLFYTHIMQQFTLRPAQGEPWPEPIGTLAVTYAPPLYKITAKSRA